MGSARRVIAILGAGGTLGTALSRQLAAEPDTDLVLSDLSEDALAQAPDDLAASAGGVATVPADISDFAAVENVVSSAVDRFGRLDVLISNAGVLSPNGRIHNLSTEDWERSYRVNVLGPVNGIRAAVPVMRAQRSGSIILTASVAGLTAWSHSSPYCVTKAGRHPPGQGGRGRVRPRRHPRQLRVPGHLPVRDARRPARRGGRRHRGQAPARPRLGRRPGRRLLLPGGRRLALDHGSAIVVDGGYAAP